MIGRFRPIEDGHAPSDRLRNYDDTPCALDGRYDVRVQAKKIGRVVLVLQGEQSVVVAAVVSVNLLLWLIGVVRVEAAGVRFDRCPVFS